VPFPDDLILLELSLSSDKSRIPYCKRQKQYSLLQYVRYYRPCILDILSIDAHGFTWKPVVICDLLSKTDFDSLTGLCSLHDAIRSVLEGGTYWSDSMAARTRCLDPIPRSSTIIPVLKIADPHASSGKHSRIGQAAANMEQLMIQSSRTVLCSLHWKNREDWRAWQSVTLLSD
jgi:hypothetical protein